MCTIGYGYYFQGEDAQFQIWHFNQEKQYFCPYVGDLSRLIHIITRTTDKSIQTLDTWFLNIIFCGFHV